MHIQLGGIDYAILLIYFAFVIGIGWVLKRYMKGSADFFLSGRSIPAWVTGPGVHLRQPRRAGSHRHGRLAAPSTAS